MRFNGSVIDFKSSGNEFSAKKFDGKAWVEFEKIKNKPSAIKIKSECGKGDINISIQLGERIDSMTTGNGIIHINDCADGKYMITVTAKNAENVSLKCEFI